MKGSPLRASRKGELFLLLGRRSREITSRYYTGFTLKQKDNQNKLREPHLVRPSLSLLPPSHPLPSSCAPQSRLSPQQHSQLSPSSPSQRPSPPTPSSQLEQPVHRPTKSSRPSLQLHSLEGSPQPHLVRRSPSIGWRSLGSSGVLGREREVGCRGWVG